MTKIKEKIVRWYRSQIAAIKYSWAKIKYWYPVLRKDTDSDWVCLFVILKHKLESIRAELYPNGENQPLDRCLQKMYAITELRCENAAQLDKLIADAFDIIRVNYSRWYK